VRPRIRRPGALSRRFTRYLLDTYLLVHAAAGRFAIRSPTCPASRASAALAPAIECRPAGARGRAGTTNCPVSMLFYFGGQRLRARLVRALRSGLP